MPSSSSSGDVTTYTALPPPKEQKKFTERRTSVKRPKPTPKLRRDQSTLTQHDFSTPSSTRDELPNSSEDEEYQEPRPKKRRRKGKFDEKEKGQVATMTQFHRDWFGKTSGKCGFDDDEFQIWKDYDSEVEGAHVVKGLGMDRLISSAGDANEENDNHEPEIPETSQCKIASSQRAENDVVSGKDRKLVSFQTPRRVRFRDEVPSSQTPPSTKGSTQTSAWEMGFQRKAETQRSPLKERSINAEGAAGTSRKAESRSPTMRMLEKVRFDTRQVPLKDHVLPSKDVRPGLEAIKEPFIQAPPQKLQRVTTIDDSQSEDLNLSKTPSLETAQNALPMPGERTIEQDFQSGYLAFPYIDTIGSSGKYRRVLKRVNTVQDSQYEEPDLLSDRADDGDREAYSSDPEDADQYEDDEHEATFDPANSALDRDAARFDWTQTQHRLPNINEVYEDSETDYEDPDERDIRFVRNHAIPISDEPSQGLGEHVKLTSDPPAPILQENKPQRQGQAPHEHMLSRPVSRDDSAYESGDLAHRAEIEIPSSPPPLLRTSQVSTVVPTQASLPEPRPRNPDVLHTLQDSNPVHIVNIPTSPQKSGPTYPSAVSSSPLPFPPWLSPEKARDKVEGQKPSKGKAQLGDLVDYSLPPPPSMSSSARRTPMSSST